MCEKWVYSFESMSVQAMWISILSSLFDVFEFKEKIYRNLLNYDTRKLVLV